MATPAHAAEPFGRVSVESPFEDDRGKLPLQADVRLICDPDSTSIVAQNSNTAKIARLRRATGIFISLWWKEVAAGILLLAAAILTFATLYLHQGQPLPEWPHAITISALLSVYSVIARMAMAFLMAESLAQLKWVCLTSKRPLYDFALYDAATRGPLGALNLFWSRPGWWQATGCALFASLIAIGPFTQQALQYQTCSAPDKAAIASVPRTMAMWPAPHSGYSYELTPSEQLALDSNVYTSGQIQATCPTGSCTFAPYKSLGYCSQCVDISDEVKITAFNETIRNSTWRTQRLITTSSLPLRNMTNIYVDLSERILNDDIAMMTADRFTNLAAVNKGQILFGQTAAMIDNRTMDLPWEVRDRETLDYMHLAQPVDPTTGNATIGCEDSDGPDATWRCRGYGAADCKLIPCVRTYSAQTTNGHFEETILNTEIITDSVGLSSGAALESHGQSLFVPCMNSTQLSQVQKNQFKYDGAWKTPWIGYVSFDLKDQLDRDLLAQGCIATWEAFFMFAYTDYLESGGNLTGGLSVNTGAVISYRGSSLLRTLHNFGNFSFERTEEVYRNISLSLTNLMRSSVPPAKYAAAAIPAMGIAYTNKTCLHVEWEWLAFPGFMVIATLIFTIAVSLVARRRLGPEATTWKTSSLPLIFTGHMGDDARDSAEMDPLKADTAYRRESCSIGDEKSLITTGQHLENMENAARGMTVHLRRDGNDRLMLWRER
jgi:hypothetical protein